MLPTNRAASWWNSAGVSGRRMFEGLTLAEHVLVGAARARNEQHVQRIEQRRLAVVVPGQCPRCQGQPLPLHSHWHRGGGCMHLGAQLDAQRGRTELVQ